MSELFLLKKLQLLPCSGCRNMVVLLLVISSVQLLGAWATETIPGKAKIILEM